MATAKKKATPAKGAWVPPWAKKEAPAKGAAKKSVPKKKMGGATKKSC